MKNVILATVLLMSGAYANAEGWVDIHLASEHLNTGIEFNEKNYGVGLSLPVTPNADLISGVFKNSFDKTSGYLGADLHTPDSKLISCGVKLGFVSGYVGTPMGDSLPVMVVPHININIHSNFRTVIGYIPAITEGQVDVITLSVGVKF